MSLFNLCIYTGRESTLCKLGLFWVPPGSLIIPLNKTKAPKSQQDPLWWLSALDESKNPQKVAWCTVRPFLQGMFIYLKIQDFKTETYRSLRDSTKGFSSPWVGLSRSLQKLSVALQWMWMKSWQYLLRFCQGSSPSLSYPGKVDRPSERRTRPLMVMMGSI